MPGIFTVSLDFELHWGVFDKKDRNSREQCYRNTLNLIPRMLDLFAEYNVHVTWATVGSLMAGDEQEWKRLKPDLEPDYVIERYSAYKYAMQNGLPAQYRWAHFAPEIVKRILDYPGQELGTHTFCHFYCLELQHRPGAFAADLQAARQAAAKFNSKPVSLVFPRNQFNADCLKTCYENGIRVVRVNPPNWFWSPVNDNGAHFIRKLSRTADAYIGMGSKHTSYPLEAIIIKPGEPILLPASRFLRPWLSRYRFANSLRLWRLCRELRTAAVRNECYHLWWHPENFGDYPEQNMKGLRFLLRHFRRYQEKYGMESWNMGEYAKNLYPVTNNKTIAGTDAVN